MEAIIVRIVDKMPEKIRAFTVVDENGDYNVYIADYVDKKSAWAHEVQHILRDDFYNNLDIKIVEGQ